MTEWHGREPDIMCEWYDEASPLARPCSEQAAHVAAIRYRARGGAWNGRLCDGHLQAKAERIASAMPLVRDPRIAACVVGAITGATPPLLADLLRAGCLDPAMLEVALDEVERLCLYDPDAWPTDAAVEWPEVDAHGTGYNPHVWLPYLEDSQQRVHLTLGFEMRRCPCGMFEHEAGRRGMGYDAAWADEPVDGVMTRDRMRQEYRRASIALDAADALFGEHGDDL